MKSLFIFLLLFTSSVFSQETPSSIVNCDKYPEAIGCSNYGTVDAPELSDQSFSFSSVLQANKKTFSSSAQCPADLDASFTVFGGAQSLSISFQPFCDFASAIRPMVLLISAFFAGVIFMGTFKL
jgi:Neisseria meningitidis TspB protein